MKTIEEIFGLYKARQVERGAYFEQARIISDHYNNNVVLPLPEMSDNDKPAVANLIAQGIDQHAMRVASVLPDVYSPPLKPGDKASERRARQRKQAWLGMWETNSYELLQKKRARWLVAYAQAPVWIVPNRRMRQPQWVLRTPLETYPGRLDDGQMQPDDCLFAVTRTVGWVKKNYPDVPVSAFRQYPNPFTESKGLEDSDTVDLIQYEDADELVTLLTGRGEAPLDAINNYTIREAEYGYRGARIINITARDGGKANAWCCELQRIPNRVGQCRVVVPGRISLNYPKGQFDDNTGLFQMQAKLMAMEVNAVANSIWPDQWLIGDGQTQPKIIKAADGRRGIVGEVQAQNMITTQMQPGLQTPTVIDRLERAQRLNGAVPADFGGESASNIRTGRRGENVLSAAVDYVIQEHQQILARSAQTELQIAAAIDLNVFGGEKKSYYVSWKGAKGRLDYRPRDIWTEDRTAAVSYVKAGADINALTVEIGQLRGVGLISAQTAGRMHPDVPDPEAEQDQIVYESLNQAVLASLQQRAAAGDLPVTDVARIAELVRSDRLELFEAVRKVQEEAQERQATPALPDAPEAQPGIEQPGMGAEAGATVAPPSPSLSNLSQLIRAVRTPAQAARGR